MTEDRKIQLVFKTENDKNFSLYIDEPKEPYNEYDIKDAMTSIIENNIIETSNGNLFQLKAHILLLALLKKLNYHNIKEVVMFLLQPLIYSLTI